MDLSAIIQSVVSPKINLNTSDLSRLPAGSVLSGKVVSVDANGTALLDFNKFKAYAKIAFPVNAGQKLHLKVIKNSEQVSFKVATPQLSGINSTPTFSHSIPHMEIITDKTYKTLLSDIQSLMRSNTTLPNESKIPSSILQSLEKINDFYQPVNLKKEIAKLVPQLKAYAENSGMFFEKKIEQLIDKLLRSSPVPPQDSLHTILDTKKATPVEILSHSQDVREMISKDLKPDLLSLKNFLEDNQTPAKAINSKSIQGLKRTVEQLLANIDQQQNIAIKRPNLPDTIQVFSHVIPFQEQDQKAKFKIYYPSKKNDKNFGHRVSILLEMDRLGTVRADLSPINGDLNINFFVDNDEARDIISGELKTLSKALEPLFNHNYLKTVVSQKKIEKFETEDLNVDSNKILDVKA